MSKRSNIALKNISSNLILQIVIIISGFIMPKLLISNFGSDTYGLVASITQFLSLIVLLESGIGPVIKAKLYKYIAKDEKEKILLILKSADSFFKKIGYIFIGYVILLCIFYPMFNNEFEPFYIIMLILIMSISTLFEYFFGIVYNLYLQADKKYYVVTKAQIVCYIVNIILVVLLIHFGASIFIVRIANLIAFSIKPFYQSYYVRKKLNIYFKDIKGKYSIENKFDGLSQHIAYVVYSNTDVMVLTLFSNMTTIAVYSVHNMVAAAVKNVVNAFTNGMDSIFGDMFARGENDVLTRTFSMYEFVFYTISMIIYLATLVLIVPFIRIYTTGITDANYIEPAFAFVIILAGLATVIRIIYGNLIYSIGHFKQTNFICWVEAISNVLISTVFVLKYGLVGVAIGTFVSALIRMVYFMYYSSKIVLKRDFKICIKWLVVTTVEVLIITIIFNRFLRGIVLANYFEWIVYAIIVCIFIAIMVLLIHVIFNYRVFKDVLEFIKEKIEKKENKHA